MHSTQNFRLPPALAGVSYAELDSESGLAEDELEASRATLRSLATAIDCECTLLRERVGVKGMIEEYLVRKNYEDNDFLEVK